MSADFYLKQHLNMSPNAKIKNLVPETLNAVPPESEWRLGRIWYNTSIGKFQSVNLKLDPQTGLPYEPHILEVVLLGSDEIGFTRDGEYYPDGLFEFSTTTKISTAVDEINEALKDLAPAEASPLFGDLVINVVGGFKSGKIAKQNDQIPELLRLDDLSDGDYITYIITDNKLSAELPINGYMVKDKQQLQFGRADQGTIVAVYDNIEVDNGIDLFNNFNETSRDYYGVVQGFLPDINQTITLNDGTSTNIIANPNKDLYRSSTQILTINTVERYNDFKKWQRGTGELNIGTISGQTSISPGKHSFYVKHIDVVGGDYSTNISEIFYDYDKTIVNTIIDNFYLKSGITKSISGVEFFYDNIAFNLSLTAENIFANTYWDHPLSLTLAYSDAGNVIWNDSSSNLAGELVPNWNDRLILTDYVINFTGTGVMLDKVEIYAKGGKVTTGWGPTTSFKIDLLIDTNNINNNSNLLKETFKDEDYRLPDSINFDDITLIGSKSIWDSEVLLEQYNAQQFLGKLKKANTDYTNYGIAVDYSLFSSDNQFYYRSFQAPLKSNSNGRIKILTLGNIGVDFDIFIKFPSLTGWLDLNILYDVQDFSNNSTVDGTGCATDINKIGDRLEIGWTIGANSTVDSNYGYFLKIVLYSDIEISEIEEISDNWR